MRPGLLNICWVSLYLLIASAASPRDNYRGGVVDRLSGIDFSKYDYQEPTCEELRAMWRFSKRQGRASENNNEVPTYRDPFAYNLWEDKASIRSVGGGRHRRPLVYGRLVHSVPPRIRYQETTPPERIRAFEEVARMFGTPGHIPKIHNGRKTTAVRVAGGRDGLGPLTPPMQAGSFQHLKEIIQSERARELHEQKMSEENAVRESALQYQRMMDDYQRDRDDDRARARSSYKGRSRGHLEPVYSLPAVLTPSKYGRVLYSNMNYMPRSYQGPMTQPLPFPPQQDYEQRHDAGDGPGL